MKATDYITLDVPAPFNPDNPATFRVHFSRNFMGKYATLVVYGYEMQTPTQTYTGGKFTQYANVAENREGILEYVIPGGTLGHDSDTYSLTGQMRAYVMFNSTVGSDGHVNPEDSNTSFSNQVYVPMSCLSNADFTFEYTEPDGSYLSTASRYTIWMHIVYRTSAGLINGNDINSYRVQLYDDDMNIVYDSGERKDWYVNVPNKSFRLSGLKDNTDYYVMAFATTNSGITLSTPATLLRVRYGSLPEKSYRVSLSNVPTGVKIDVNLIGLNYTKIAISRREYTDDGTLGIKEADYPNFNYTITDHLTIPNKTYIYTVVVYNGRLIVDSFSNYIEYTSNYVVISDKFDSYAAIGSITKYPISRNDRGAEIEVMDNQYPYYIINGDANFERGSVDAIFGELDDCQLNTDNAEYSKILRAWLNNGEPKLLCYYNGESWIVSVSGVQTTDPQNTDTLNTSFNWVEISEGDDVTKYAEIGLVMNNG